jgi:cyclase
MITKRIIPCLDVRDGKVVKGVNFEGVRDVDSPVKLAELYNEMGADELVFYDITATNEGRELFTDIVEQVANEVFIPLTVGGGINTLDDFDRVLKAGADKVSVNSGAIKNPELIREAALKYGNQCVVLSVDVKRVEGVFKVFLNGGRKETDMEAIEWIKKGCQLGAGEIVVNSIDTDGVKGGFDLELLEAVGNVVDVPVIASGGAGNMEDFKILFEKLPKIDAGLAASIFHFGEVKIPDLKNYLKDQGIEIRI